MKFSLSNLWTELGTTITAVAVVSAALAPMLHQAMPNSPGEWLAWAALAATSLSKVFGKTT